jgi:predicted SAM-dependent methyltransferase
MEKIKTIINISFRIIRGLIDRITLLPFIVRCRVKFLLIKFNFAKDIISKIDLCGGTNSPKGYFNIDMFKGADLYINLEKQLLPFAENSVDVAICISAINYFTRERGQKIIKDVHRVLRPGGIARFATQDLKLIAKKYIAEDKNFFFQKLPDGRERFKGKTMGDKINSWFYGYPTAGGNCKYFYDYETLAFLFKETGFKVVEKRNYRESRIPGINKIDNRPEQMFFLEAVK